MARHQRMPPQRPDIRMQSCLCHQTDYLHRGGVHIQSFKSDEIHQSDSLLTAISVQPTIIIPPVTTILKRLFENRKFEVTPLGRSQIQTDYRQHHLLLTLRLIGVMRKARRIAGLYGRVSQRSSLERYAMEFAEFVDPIQRHSFWAL